MKDFMHRTLQQVQSQTPPQVSPQAPVAVPQVPPLAPPQAQPPAAPPALPQAAPAPAATPAQAPPPSSRQASAPGAPPQASQSVPLPASEEQDTAWSSLEIGLLVLGVLIVIGALGAGVWWWRRRKRGGGKPVPAPGRRTMESDRVLRIYRRFLSMQPWRRRAAISDLPTVVVLGPAGSGKSRLVEMDVDWRRQASQFMPSCTDDPLLQIYLGPEAVVHEVSTPLLEDGSKYALRALRRLWKASFGRRQALVVVTLDVRWLADTPPDEVRRVAHLLRGKINLVSETCQAPVETRLCVTHMDEMEGFLDFARELRGHGELLHFDAPQPGEEQRLDTNMQALEKYLASGLTSLPLESFERMERFYSRINAPLAALSRFIIALREGGRLSIPLSLSRVYFSSTSPEARAPDTLSVKAEIAPARLRANYRRKHMLRCAALLIVGCLPVIAAYTHFHDLLREAQGQISRFDETVRKFQKEQLAVEGPVLEQRGRAAMDAMERLWRATQYWPPLRSSYTGDLAKLRQDMSNIIRDYYLRPLVRQCQQQCEQCASLVPGCEEASATSPILEKRLSKGSSNGVCQAQRLCRPERLLYLLALVHASRDDELGHFVLSSLKNEHAQRWAWATSLGLNLSEIGSREKEEEWVETLGLAEAVVGDYVVASDEPWSSPSASAPGEWSRWPFKWLTLESYLKPWQGHFRRLNALINDSDLRQEEWEALQEERQYLQTLLAESRSYGSSRLVLDLLNSSDTSVNEKSLAGISHTLDALRWIERNRKTLEDILRMEEEAYTGIRSVRKMSWVEFLTLSKGLFTASGGDGPLRVDVLGEPFEFRPQEVSRHLLRTVIRIQEETPGGLFESSRRGRASDASVVPLTEQGRFAAEIKPLVDRFNMQLEGSDLAPEEKSARRQYVMAGMDQFANQYRLRLFDEINRRPFVADSRRELYEKLKELSQPSSNLVDVLRTVASRADLGELKGEYYESLRNNVAPFKPLALLMKEENGNYPKLIPYLSLVSQLHSEITTGLRGGDTAGAEGKAAAAGMAPGGPGASKAATGPQLPDLLTPLGRVALSMLLEEKDSYLNKVDEWLDQQGILGEFREPFRRPFVAAMNLGREEIEKTVLEQWEQEWATHLQPLVERYPFTGTATEEVEPSQLQILHPKQGAFWSFAHRVVAPLCTVQGTDWSLRAPLKRRLETPPRMLETLNRLAELTSLLWTAEGKTQALSLQVLPQPLPPSPVSGSFVTMSYLQCGKVTTFSFNQNPTWQEFALDWWDPQPASIGLEFRSPTTEERDYRAQEISGSFWNCFRLLESASAKDGRQWTWTLMRKGESRRGVEVRFGVRGEPWVPFRRLSQ